MKTKWVMLLAFCFALLIPQFALAQYTGGSYDGYAMGTSQSDTSLPVQLSTFTATISGDKVIIKGRTESEVNNVGFSIYRSEVESGKYTKITFVKGAGMPTDYQFIDENAEAGKTYYYYLEDIDITGEKNKSRTIKGVVLPARRATPIPKEFALLQNFPNPFNPETWIPYQLAENASVEIRIYDAKGIWVRNVLLGEKEAGYYKTRETAAYWDGVDNLGQPVASGVYFYQIKAGDFTETRKMVVVK